MPCFIWKHDFHHLVSPTSVLFSLVGIVLFVQTVSVKIIKMYYSFNKYRHLKTVDTFIYIFAVKNGLGNIFGTRILTVLIGSIFKQNNITTVENDATGQYDHNICSVTLKSWTHFYIFSISLVVYMVCVIF